MQRNDIVSFTESYRTAANVVADRIVWGKVTDIYDHPGDKDGHIFKGTYVEVLTLDGDTAVVMFDRIDMVMP